MRVPKKEGISREEREKNVGRFVITRCLCNANLGAATRISGTRGEFRARGANLGPFRCSSDRQIRIVFCLPSSAKQRAAASNHRTLAVPPPFSGGSGMSVLAAVCKGCSRRSKDTMSRIVSCANPVWLLQAFAARRACLGQSVFAECARPAYMGRGVLYALEILANTLHLDRAGDGATGEGHLLSRARGVSGVLLAPQTVLPTRRASF